MKYKYIISDAEILGGKPIIKGTRLSVQFILELIASGATIKDIASEFPHIEEDAIHEALASRKAANVAEIGLSLRAGTKCGTCLPELRSIVDHERHAHEHAHAV